MRTSKEAEGEQADVCCSRGGEWGFLGAGGELTGADGFRHDQPGDGGARNHAAERVRPV